MFDFLECIAHIPNTDALTLEEQEKLSLEISNIIKEEHIPTVLIGKINRVLK